MAPTGEGAVAAAPTAVAAAQATAVAAARATAGAVMAARIMVAAKTADHTTVEENVMLVTQKPPCMHVSPIRCWPRIFSYHISIHPVDVVFVNSLISVCYASSLLEGSRRTKFLGESNSLTPERDIEPTRHDTMVITFKIDGQSGNLRGFSK